MIPSFSAPLVYSRLRPHEGFGFLHRSLFDFLLITYIRHMYSPQALPPRNQARKSTVRSSHSLEGECCARQSVGELRRFSTTGTPVTAGRCAAVRAVVFPTTALAATGTPLNSARFRESKSRTPPLDPRASRCAAARCSASRTRMKWCTDKNRSTNDDESSLEFKAFKKPTKAAALQTQKVFSCVFRSFDLSSHAASGR